MYNYDQQIPVYNQPIEFLYARGLQPGANAQSGIGPFVNGVRQTMQGINGMGVMHSHGGQIPGQYLPQQPPMRPQIMQIEEGLVIFWNCWRVFNGFGDLKYSHSNESSNGRVSYYNIIFNLAILRDLTFNWIVDKRDTQISEMEDLIAQLNTDKNYFEKELIDMQIKQSDLLDELKRKDKEIYDLQKRNEGVDITIESHLSRIQNLEDGIHIIESKLIFLKFGFVEKKYFRTL